MQTTYIRPEKSWWKGKLPSNTDVSQRLYISKEVLKKINVKRKFSHVNTIYSSCIKKEPDYFHLHLEIWYLKCLNGWTDSSVCWNHSSQIWLMVKQWQNLQPQVSLNRISHLWNALIKQIMPVTIRCCTINYTADGEKSSSVLIITKYFWFSCGLVNKS